MDALLVARPDITLDKVVDHMSFSWDIRNAVGAVLAEKVHEIRGSNTRYAHAVTFRARALSETI